MKKILISVILPVYNAEKYLDNSIKSILSQSYKNIELIIINDGSSDNSKKICEKYQKDDKRIRIINKSNKGVSAARNDGIKEAKGEYICFFDADDFLENDMIEKMVESAQANCSDIIISEYKYLYENTNKVELYKLKNIRPITAIIKVRIKIARQIFLICL